MAMQPLSSEDLNILRKLCREVGRGETLTQERVQELVAHWEPKVRPDAKERAEDYAIARPDGTTTGTVAPRWLCHLLGLRHRAAEIGFRTESGLIVLQRRSPTKADWPDLPDMAVAGHIPQNPDGSDRTFVEGAWKEIAEEIGLEEKDAATNLVEGRLLRVGAPYVCLDLDESRNPPFRNAEVRQILAATMTGAGLARLRFTDDEVSGILLVTPDAAWDILAREPVASGLRYSLPRYLDWLEKDK